MTALQQDQVVLERREAASIPAQAAAPARSASLLGFVGLVLSLVLIAGYLSRLL